MSSFYRLFCVLGFCSVIFYNGFTVAQDQPVTGEPVVHIVQYGDSLYSVALRYGMTMDDIANANGLTNWSHLQIGQTLIIPGLTVPDSSDVVNNPLVAGTPTKHVVQPGETLNAIAQKYGITVADLLKANNIGNPDLIYRGQELTVWTTESVDAPAEVAVESLPELNLQPGAGTNINLDSQPAPSADYDIRIAPAVQATHTVLRGETLGTIAAKYGVKWQDIATANGIDNPDHIYAGQQVLIPSANGYSGTEDLAILTGVQGPQELPKAPITTGKFILVDISDSMIYAYQDGVMVFSALGSMGTSLTPTVQGDFKIYSRYDAQTMAGADYYLPNVQWVQYFYQGYAFHGAYWHNNWGRPMSHGCVNMRNEDAYWLYMFAEIGTQIRVQA